MKNWMSYLLVMLIALQSVLAVADTHEINPSDTGHHELASHGNLASDAENSHANFPLDPESPANGLDCQHCSHFHSPQLNLLPGMACNPILGAGQLHFLGINAAATSSHPTSLFRPPRA
jgi:hypothetical protein